MPSSRKCIFRCKGDGPLFTPPKEGPVRQQWFDFIFGNEPPPKPNMKKVYVCARHFTEDCFLNKSLFDSGQISRLSLKEGAFLSYKTEPVPSPPVPPRIQSYAYKTCTVSTQLSAGTLRSQHYRSKGVQATVDSVSRGTVSVEATDSTETRPPKRPRLDLVEEENRDLNFSVNSTHEANNSGPDLSDWIDMESPPDFEDAKYIVFESALRELFESCPVCNSHCTVRQRRCGTFVAFQQHCPHCWFSRKWQSQPLKGRIPQGNLELSAAVYFNGGSFSKIEKICNTMNLKVHQFEAFKRHAQNYLEPAIYKKWKTDQEEMLEKTKRKGKLAVRGGLMLDLAGHAAKFGSYALMECEDEKVLDIQLLQRNEVGSRVNMEIEGLGRGLDLLESTSVQVDHVVTDRVPEVQEYLQERGIPHCYDACHLVKGLSEKLDALSRRKDCRALKRWLPSIKRHMSWAAYSSKSGLERVAKWTSLLNHMQNVHEHEDPLFPKCEHLTSASTNQDKWLRPDSVAMIRAKKVLLNKKVLEVVSNLSSNRQTSLEPFQNLVLNFTPENVLCSLPETLCRLYLAAMHHNESSRREQAKTMSKPLWKLRFLKSKGRTTARLIGAGVTSDLTSDLMQLVFDEVPDDPPEFHTEHQDEPGPPPLGPSYTWPLEDDVLTVKIS